MNEVFRRRLIGLAILLVLVFVLSLLLPQDEPSKTGETASTTVSLLDSDGASPPTSAPHPVMSARSASESSPPAETGPSSPSPPAAPAISDLHDDASEPAPAVRHVPPANPSAALKLSPRVSPPVTIKQPVEKEEMKPALPPAKPVLTAKIDPALSPPKPKLAESVAKPVPVPVPPPGVPTSAGPGSWYVQIGSFSDRGKADTILSLLEKIGYKGEISKVVSSSGTTLNRVRLGAFQSEAAARLAQEKVARQGYPQARVTSEGNAK